MSWKEFILKYGRRGEERHRRSQTLSSRKQERSRLAAGTLSIDTPLREVWRQIQLQLRNTSGWGTSAFDEEAAERMRTETEEWRQPRPAPKPLLTRKLMEIFLLRDVVVNKGIQKPSALPLGKFIHNLTVCYFNWEQKASAESKISGKKEVCLKSSSFGP